MKSRDNNQSNDMNNNQNGYYDENGNYIPAGYYDRDGNFIPDDYYTPNNGLTPAGYYDTNGFFIITGYYDQDGNFAPVNNPVNNPGNNYQGNNYDNSADGNYRKPQNRIEKELNKKNSKLSYLVALLLVCIIGAGFYYFKFYNKDSKVVHIDQYKVELAAYGTNRNGKVDVNITEVPEVKDADENIKKFLRKPEVKYSPKENLENGSKVDVEITLNKEEAEKKGLKLTGSFKRTLTVTGLSEENSSKKEEKKSTSNTLWNKEKSNKLYQYIKEWEKTLNQNYKEYTIDNKVNYYGLQLPGDTEKVGKSRLVLEGDKLINMKWSPEGNQKDVYNIVAVYSDIENVRGPASHLYYFTILNGEPIVLVTEQNQGNDKKYLYFKRTANVYLQEGFEKIVKG